MAKVSKRKVRGSSRVDIRIAGTSAALAAAAVLTAALWVVPSYSAGQDNAAQVESVQEQVATASNQIASLEGGAVSDAGELLTQARALDTQLPTAVDKVSLVAQLQDRATSFGLSVTRMDPSAEPVKLGSVSALSFAVGVSGPYPQVQAFLTDLTGSTASSLLGVEDLAVTSDDGQTTASLTLYAYYTDAPALQGAAGS